MLAIIQYTLFLCLTFLVIFLVKQIPSSKMKFQETAKKIYKEMYCDQMPLK